MNKLELMKTANEIRKGIVTALHSAKAGHPGGSLSATEIFTYLYFEEMNVDPKDPKKADRDRFVLSKGHTAPGLYSTLAQKGFFPKEDLVTLRHTGSYLQGHPDMKHIPGVDMSSGSLGQGISAAVGMAIAGKLDNADYRVYTLLGDGEIQEGQVWEASMLAAHRKLDNLVVIVGAHNCNLSLKAIMALVGMAALCEMKGDDTEAGEYMACANAMKERWIEMADNGDGTYRLAFDQPDTYSMKYNVVWDIVFGSHIFPAEVLASEFAGYKKRIHPYGMPLDNRKTYTKSDWLVWTATLAREKEEFEAFIEPLWRAYHNSPSRVPMTDWYDTVTSIQAGFQHRTVQGGLFMKVLEASGKCRYWD